MIIMNVMIEMLLIFAAGLAMVLSARVLLKDHKKWRTTLTVVGALIMSIPFLLALFFLFSIFSAQR